MSLLTAVTLLLGLAAAIPTPQSDDPYPAPIRVLPFIWNFKVVSQTGPGCDPYRIPSSPSPIRYSQMTFGMNTVDGSEIYYQHIAYPAMNLAIGPGVDKAKSSSWCETTAQYTEFDDREDFEKQTSNYRLRLHKNGTRILGRYELETGVDVNWKFTYFMDGEIVDTIPLHGPLTPTLLAQEDYSPSFSPRRIVMPECGTGIFRFRSDVWLTQSDEMARGRVIADRVYVVNDTAGDEYAYGVEHGFSFDFEKCGM